MNRIFCGIVYYMIDCTIFIYIFHLYKISAIKGGRTFQISNNHGHVSQ